MTDQNKPEDGYHCGEPHPQYGGVHCGLLLDQPGGYHMKGETSHEGGGYTWPGRGPGK